MRPDIKPAITQTMQEQTAMQTPIDNNSRGRHSDSEQSRLLNQIRQLLTVAGLYQVHDLMLSWHLDPLSPTGHGISGFNSSLA